MRAKARIVAVGTVQSSGGIPAPLVDAAWRAQASLLDDCLEQAAGKGSVRMSVELTLDGRGRVSRVVVEVPALGKAFARCAEAAVKAHLVVVIPRIEDHLRPYRSAHRVPVASGRAGGV